MEALEARSLGGGSEETLARAHTGWLAALGEEHAHKKRDCLLLLWYLFCFVLHI
jgi:hypothetical protein